MGNGDRAAPAKLIGINQYENLPHLNYAKRDAEKMADWYEEAGFEKVYLFTDDSPPITDASKPFPSRPTNSILRRFLRKRFDKEFLNPGDNLWFFFSGHGLRHEGKDYLMPCDADPHPEEIEQLAISFNYVSERLRRCGADNVILLLDACRDDTAKGSGLGEEELQGVITISSCSPGEKSYEIKELEQGSFTTTLLEGLRIQGEGNCATVERLYQYLRHQVPEFNRRYQKPRQNPYAIAEPASKYHLILLPRQATLQDIETLKKEAYQAYGDRNSKLAEQLWTRVLAASPADVEALKGLKRIWLDENELEHQIELKNLKKAAQLSKQQLEQSYNKQFQDLEQSYQFQLQELEKSHQLKIQEQETETQSRIEELEQFHQAQLQELEQSHQAAIEEKEGEAKSSIEELEQSYQIQLEELIRFDEKRYAIRIYSLDINFLRNRERM